MTKRLHTSSHSHSHSLKSINLWCEFISLFAIAICLSFRFAWNLLAEKKVNCKYTRAPRQSDAVYDLSFSPTRASKIIRIFPGRTQIWWPNRYWFCRWPNGSRDNRLASGGNFVECETTESKRYGIICNFLSAFCWFHGIPRTNNKQKTKNSEKKMKQLEVEKKRRKHAHKPIEWFNATCSLTANATYSPLRQPRHATNHKLNLIHSQHSHLYAHRQLTHTHSRWCVWLWCHSAAVESNR